MTIPKTIPEIIKDLETWQRLHTSESCLHTQAQIIAYDLIDGDQDHLCSNANARGMVDFIYEELKKAYRAGQLAALETSGIQPVLELEAT